MGIFTELYTSTKHARTFSVNLISTHILLCYLSSISRFLQLTPLYIAFEEYCNSLSTSKGRRRNLLSIMRAFQTSSPTQPEIHSVPQAAAMPLSFRSKVTEFTTCILLSTAHERFLSSECKALFVQGLKWLSCETDHSPL
jgi:hypothetical protein